MKDPNCLFCKIVDGKIPCDKVFENEKILVFKDIHPKAPIHYLFITKNHFQSLAHVSVAHMEIMKEIFLAIKEVTEKEGIASKGFKNVIHTGKDGGQEVPHLHIHLMSSG